MSKLNQDLADVVEEFFRKGTNDPSCREIAESLWKVQIQDVMIDAIQDQLGNVKKILEKRDASWHVMLVTKYYYENYRGVFEEGYDGMPLEEESEI